MIDDRGSIGQKRIYGLVKEIYPQYNVLWEQTICELNQRFDIFVKELGVAVEVDGDQHEKFNPFFHQDPYGLKRQSQSDNKKNMFCELNGIKMVRLRYKESLEISKDDLAKKINNTDYPSEGYYSFSCLK